MKAILKFLQTLLGINRTVEQIVRPLTSIVEELNVHAEDQRAAALAALDMAENFKQKAADKHLEADRAVAFAKNFQNFANF